MSGSVQSKQRNGNKRWKRTSGVGSQRQKRHSKFSVCVLHVLGIRKYARAVKSWAFTDLQVRVRLEGRAGLYVGKLQLQFYYSMKDKIHLRDGKGKLFVWIPSCVPFMGRRKRRRFMNVSEFLAPQRHIRRMGRKWDFYVTLMPELWRVLCHR